MRCALLILLPWSVGWVSNELQKPIFYKASCSGTRATSLGTAGRPIFQYDAPGLSLRSQGEERRPTWLQRWNSNVGLSQEFGSDVDPPQDLLTLRSRASLLRVVQSAAQELPASEILGVSAHTARGGRGRC